MPDLTNLTDVKAWLAIASTLNASDGILGELITSTSADFLRAIERVDFLADTYTEVREGDGGSRMVLRHWPVTEITTLTIGGAAVEASADQIAPGYYLDAQLDPERVNQLYLVGATFTDGAQVVVAYPAGYAEAPGDVAQAVVEWVAMRYKGRPGAGLASQREAGGEHVTYDREAPMPPSTTACAARYKRCWPSLNRRQDDLDYKITRINRNFAQAAPAAKP
jgi:hypothetical protein